MSSPVAPDSDWLGVPDLPAWVPGVRRAPLAPAPARPLRPARFAGAADPGEIDRRAALLGLLAQDLRRRHLQVAMRHYLMLVALGSPVPAAFSQRCEALLAACPPERLARIRADMARWRAHSRPSAQAPSRGFDLGLLEG